MKTIKELKENWKEIIDTAIKNKDPHYSFELFEGLIEQAKLSQKQEDDERFEKFIKRLEEHRFEMNIMVSKEFDKGFTSALKQFREIINKLTKELNGENKK